MDQYVQVDRAPTGTRWSEPASGLLMTPYITSWSLDDTPESGQPGAKYKRLRDPSTGLTYYYQRMRTV